MFLLLALLSVVFWGTVLYLALRAVRALERRRQGGGALPETAERLARLEAAVAALTTDVERIEEGQRFTTRLLTDASDATSFRADRKGAD